MCSTFSSPRVQLISVSYVVGSCVLQPGFTARFHSSVHHLTPLSDPVETELQLAISQLFAGHVTMVILGASLQEMCYGRLQLCRDVMVFLCLVCAMCSVEVSECGWVRVRVGESVGG